MLSEEFLRYVDKILLCNLDRRLRAFCLGSMGGKFYLTFPSLAKPNRSNWIEKSNYAILSHISFQFILFLSSLLLTELVPSALTRSIERLPPESDVVHSNQFTHVWMMAAAERIRTISVGGEYDSELGMSDVFSSSIHSEPSLMNTSQISTSSQDSQRLTSSSKSPHNLPSKNVSIKVIQKVKGD
jgi:hypothetical protein